MTRPSFLGQFFALALGLFGLPFPSTKSLAEDSAIASQLETLGGKITLQEGFITQINLTDCSKITESELRTIGALPRLKNLTLYGKVQALNEATAPLLANLKTLESLNTEGAQLTDAGLKILSSLTNLRSASFFHLSFRMEGFTGSGFAAWKTMPGLEKLTVAGMSMGDEGFAAIGSLTQLRELSTWHTYQSEAGNAEIAKLPRLTKLQLGQRLPRPGVTAPSLSDASLPTLASIKTLESLKLSEARLTFAALKTLKALPQLKLLTISESDLSPDDLQTLRSELPNLKIEFQPLTEEQAKKLQMHLKQ